MKNLITSAACMMILLALVMQFAQNQVMHNRLAAVDQAAANFKEIVKEEGCISETNEKNLKKEITKVISCSEKEITVTGNRKPSYRGTLIHYYIAIPVKNLISAAKFWGIDEKDNEMNYEIDRYTTSEYIGR